MQDNAFDNYGIQWVKAYSRMSSKDIKNKSHHLRGYI